jgi:hypothetical protein
MGGHDIPRLEGHLKDLSKRLSRLRFETDLEELIKLIHRPGWTTPAELYFATIQAETAGNVAAALEGMVKGLVQGARMVG